MFHILIDAVVSYLTYSILQQNSHLLFEEVITEEESRFVEGTVVYTTRKVRFSSTVNLILIPTIKSMSNFKNEIWYKDEDYMVFKNDVIFERRLNKIYKDKINDEEIGMDIGM